MNTSQSQNKYNISTISTQKTHDHLDRLDKISGRLNNIHFNIENDKYTRYEQLEQRLAILDENLVQTQDADFKTFNELKEQITKCIQMIEDDKAAFDAAYEKKQNYLSQLEFKLMRDFEAEAAETREMEKRLITKIDNGYNTLKNELAREEKNRNESIDNFNKYLDTEVPKIIDQMKVEQGERVNGDEMILKMIEKEFANILLSLEQEKKLKEENELAFEDMIKSIITKIQADLHQERVDREATEKTLMSLLEDCCGKMDVVSVKDI